MAQTLMKRHARLAGDPDRLLWVGDEADWRAMRADPRPRLVCPQGGCGDLLQAVRNQRGTRFLRRSHDGGVRGGGSCDHWWAGRGGPESPRHLWLKARLTAICLHLGWFAVPEDPTTFADVWIPDARLALEVQLRRTDTVARTRARFAAGARTVVWFIAADVTAARILFGAPAVRFDVVARDEPTVSVAPWQDPGRPARLVVFATIWRWEDWRLVTGAMSAYRFLAEVLSGEMGWCPPGTPGLPAGRGGWVRWSDLALAAGMPDLPAALLQSQLPPRAAAWIDAQWQRRRRSPARPRRGEKGGPFDG
jgi:hypothetical protein